MLAVTPETLRVFPEKGCALIERNPRAGGRMSSAGSRVKINHRTEMYRCAEE
jgi:hypothetical protein